MMNTEYARQILEANLAPAWLRRCGTTGVPGEWDSGEVLSVVDDDFEVELRPMWASEDKEMSAGFPFGSAEVSGFYWRFYIRGEDLEREEETILYQNEFSVDDRYSDYVHYCDPQKRPEVPEAVVLAYAALN
jgi:hypothetical protein